MMMIKCVLTPYERITGGKIISDQTSSLYMLPIIIVISTVENEDYHNRLVSIQRPDLVVFKKMNTNRWVCPRDQE